MIERLDLTNRYLWSLDKDKTLAPELQQLLVRNCNEYLEESRRAQASEDALKERVRVLEEALSRAQRALVLSDCDYFSAPMIDGWEWYEAATMIANLLPEDEWSKQFILRRNAVTGGKA